CRRVAAGVDQGGVFVHSRWMIPHWRSVGLDIPDEWKAAADLILRRQPITAMVLGPVDAGKSSLCRALLASAAREQLKARLIDSDVGQKLVGPPAAVTAADVQTPAQLAA